MTGYETYALRYAYRDGNTASETYYRYELYGEPERTFAMDYFFWVARNRQRTVLVDCGYSRERALERGRTLVASPEELLARVGVAADEVDHVVLSHLHWDHVGNTGLFPNATFSIARREFEFWRGPYGHRPCVGLALGDEELSAIEELERAGRLFLVEDDVHDLYPGIRLITSPGHTPGQIVTDVTASTGSSIVLASDAVHYCDEMTLDRPFHVFTDIAGMYRTYETLRSLAARPDTMVIAGHDPAVTTQYKEIAENCLDLTAPIAL
jgi:glyoxylase-like metal-dependent hydrolase (beta-lactamase superfamily II)